MAPRRPIQVEVRIFWATVDRWSGPCWEWQGPRDKWGYGYQRSYGGKHYHPHRLAYVLTWGAIPEGLTVDHLCNNPPCCNPAHLRVATQSENSRAKLLDRTTCRRGHPWTPENTQWSNVADRKYPRRECKACRQIRKQRMIDNGWVPTEKRRAA